MYFKLGEKMKDGHKPMYKEYIEMYRMKCNVFNIWEPFYRPLNIFFVVDAHF